jgi:hypothetical protein
LLVGPLADLVTLPKMVNNNNNKAIRVEEVIKKPDLEIGIALLANI